MIFKKFGGNKRIKELKSLRDFLIGCQPVRKFAYLPVELTNEDFVWFQYYYELNYVIKDSIKNNILETISDDLLDTIEYRIYLLNSYYEIVLIEPQGLPIKSIDEFDDYINYNNSYETKINESFIKSLYNTYNNEDVNRKIFNPYAYTFEPYIYTNKKDKFIAEVITEKYSRILTILVTYCNLKLQVYKYFDKNKVIL